MRHAIATFPAILLAACATAVADMAETRPDPRQGKEVNEICFSDQIRNWRANDNRSVIVEKGSPACRLSKDIGRRRADGELSVRRRSWTNFDLVQDAIHAEHRPGIVDGRPPRVLRAEQAC